MNTTMQMHAQASRRRCGLATMMSLLGLSLWALTLTAMAGLLTAQHRASSGASREAQHRQSLLLAGWMSERAHTESINSLQWSPSQGSDAGPVSVTREADAWRVTVTPQQPQSPAIKQLIRWQSDGSATVTPLSP